MRFASSAQLSLPFAMQGAVALRCNHCWLAVIQPQIGHKKIMKDDLFDIIDNNEETLEEQMKSLSDTDIYSRVADGGGVVTGEKGIERSQLMSEPTPSLITSVEYDYSSPKADEVADSWTMMYDAHRTGHGYLTFVPTENIEIRRVRQRMEVSFGQNVIAVNHTHETGLYTDVMKIVDSSFVNEFISENIEDVQHSHRSFIKLQRRPGWEIDQLKEDVQPSDNSVGYSTNWVALISSTDERENPPVVYVPQRKQIAVDMRSDQSFRVDLDNLCIIENVPEGRDAAPSSLRGDTLLNVTREDLEEIPSVEHDGRYVRYVNGEESGQLDIEGGKNEI